MSFYTGKMVLVTGAAGFIGSHLTDKLLSEGARVIGVDNFITGREKNVAHLASNPNFTLIKADVSTVPTSYLPADLKLDCVFHMASPASPPGYQEHPIETYQVNSLGTHLLCQYLVKHQPSSRLLFASTSEAYGDPLVHPQPETYFGNVNPNGVRSMYDEAKRFGEMVCGVHYRTFKLDTRIIRIFNTYGPRMDPKDGRSLVDFVTHLLKDEPLVLYGGGKQTRSYCFVDDLVRGILLVMESDKTSGETVNLGNPMEQTMLELIKSIEAVTGKTAQLTFEAARPDDPKRRQPDITKAKTVLGWEPAVSITEGLTKTVAYFQQELS